MYESILKFKGYSVEKIDLSVNNEFIVAGEVPLKININRDIKVNTDNQRLFKVLLTVMAGSKDKNSPVNIEICMSGIFEMKDDSEFLVSNATAILFPYLRSVVSVITTTSNISPLNLPIVNIAEMFDEIEKEEE